MDTQASMDQLRVCETLTCESISKLDKKRAAKVMEDKDVVQLSPPLMLLANGGTLLCPTTPDSNKESGDLMSNFTSPLTLVSLPPRGFDSPSYENEDSPSTPKESVFDPFAPGPDKLMNAPMCMKYMEESQGYVARRLNFVSDMNIDGCAKHECDDEDDILLESVYDALLEAIISTHTEEVLAEISSLDPSPDGFKAPTSAPLLNGIAETCPGAPLRPSRKLRNIDYHGLCRKLEF